jgi:hypothetical protein
MPLVAYSNLGPGSMLFVVFHSLSRQMATTVLQIRPRPLPSTSLLNHNSQILDGATVPLLNKPSPKCWVTILTTNATRFELPRMWTDQSVKDLLFLLLLLVGWDWVSWYCGHYWPIGPAQMIDRWWWLWRNWWNEDWQGKPKYSEKTCPSATFSTTNPTWLDPGSNPGRRGGKPATNRLSYGAAQGW